MALDQAVLDDIVARVVEAARPEKIVLFGSAARGDMGPHGDMDLLVVRKDDGERALDVEKRIHMRLYGVGVGVDAFVATPEYVERYKDAHCLIVKPALREGRVIYEAP